MYLEGGASDTTTTDTTRRRRGQSHDTDNEASERYTRSLEDQVEYLRGQLDQERTASAELRRIVAGLTQRIPEIEAPQEARGSTETVGAEPGRVEDRPGAAGPQTPVERPWWRRVFGG